MFLLDLFLRRPVVSVAVSVMLFAGGAFSLFQLPVGLFPRVDVDVISIGAYYPGASAELMDGRVASEIVSAISDVEDIDHVTSNSSAGRSEVLVHLDLGADPQEALTGIIERIRSISRFPEGMDPVQVKRREADRAPDFALAFLSREMRPAQVTDYLQRVVQPRLESIPGVAAAEVLGSEYAMRIWIDPRKLERHNLTPLDIRGTLRLDNVQVNAGILRSGDVRSQIAAETGLSTVDDFGALPLVTVAGTSPVTLSDVARVEFGSQQPRIQSRFNGEPATVVFVRWQQDSNPLQVGERVKQAIKDLRAGYPYDLKSEILIDNTEYIERAVREVFETILITVTVVTLVIFLGSGALRAVLIPVVAIPLSLVGVCLLLYVAGFSINTLTLLAMVLAIGLVVDDAIVVLDTALARMAAGDSPGRAALLGTRAIAGSLVSMTLTLAVAYLPLSFIGGLVGKLFTEFAVTLAGSVLLSGVLAVSLTPVMCARILSARHGQTRAVRFVEGLHHRFRRAYQRSLVAALRWRTALVWVWLACLVGTVGLFLSLPQELASKEDQGSLMVLASAPTSANIDFMDTQAQRLQALYRSLPEVQNYNYVVGVPGENQLMSFLRLRDWAERKQSAMDMQPALQAKLSELPALQSVAIVPTSLPGAGGLPFQFVLKHEDKDYRMLDALSEALLRRMRASGMFLFANKDLRYDASQERLVIDRQRAAEYGVSVGDIGLNISLAFANAKLQPFTYRGRTYDVVMEMDPRAPGGTQTIGDLLVRTRNDALIRLDALTTRDTQVVPATLNSFQRQASVTISGVLAPGVGLSQAVDAVQRIVAEMKPRGVTTDLAGETRKSFEENKRLHWTFALAITGVYFLLVLQFLNFRDPCIVILGSIPLSVLGALLALHELGISLNIYTQIGMLTLAGLISKQGILMVQAANALRSRGARSVYAAIVRASGVRFRAILLTSATMLLGALPLLFATGPASVSRFELGIVIVSGMSAGSILTLYLLPALYVSVAAWHREPPATRAGTGQATTDGIEER